MGKCLKLFVLVFFATMFQFLQLYAEECLEVNAPAWTDVISNDSSGLASASTISLAEDYRLTKNFWATDRQPYDHFGSSVCFSADGNTALVGSSGDDDRGSNAGAVYVYRFNTATGSREETKLVARDGAADDSFGANVSLSADGTVALVGASGDDDRGSNTGAAYIYKWNAVIGTWDETKLTATDGTAGDCFGVSVSLSGDGNTALIGASKAKASDKILNAGAAYIYKWNAATWAWDETKLAAANEIREGQFGCSVSIAADGNTALIGTLSNTAFIFKWDSVVKIWNETKLNASDGAANKFGCSVCLSADGNTALVGATGDSEKGICSGAVYIYNWNNSSQSWEEKKLVASVKDPYACFGSSIDCSADGKIILVGAYKADGNGLCSGAAYAYRWDSVTGSWKEKQFIPKDACSDDLFGYSVSLSANGDAVLIGAYDLSSVYIYQWSSPSGSGDEKKILPSNKSSGFGCSISLSADGNTALIGACRDQQIEGNIPGAAYIYRWNSAASSWEETKLIASDSGADERFGYSVSLSADGNTALIGAYGDEEKGRRAGAAYVYRWNSNTGTWEETKLVSARIDGYDLFGYSVSLSADGNTALIGAYNDEDKCERAGAAYIFKWNSDNANWEETKFYASDASINTRFGYAVKLSGDGKTALIEAYYKANWGFIYTMAVYVYKWNAVSGTWDEWKIATSDQSSAIKLGRSLGLSADGNTALIGGYGYDAQGQYLNIAFVYRWNSASAAWEETKIINPESDEFIGIYG